MTKDIHEQQTLSQLSVSLKSRSQFSFAMSVAIAIALGATTANVRGASFSLVPIDFGDGVTIRGTVTTDGTIGALLPANITSWNVEVVSRTDTLYTPANTHASLDQLFAASGQLQIATPADEFSDGGSLRFIDGVRFQAAIADFTGAFSPGGSSFFVAGANFAFQDLNQPLAAQYPAANEIAPGQYDLIPVDFGSGLSMFGTIDTDGTLGPLVPANLLDWQITVRLDEILARLTQANSRVLFADGLYSDGRTIQVANPDGQWGIGVFPRPGADPTIAQLADFTTGIDGGEARFVSPFTFESFSPLSFDSPYIAAIRVPEPTTWQLAVVAMPLAVLMIRVRRAWRQRPVQTAVNVS